MANRPHILRLLPLAAALLAAGCRTTYTTLVQDRDTVYQLAPFLYLLSGNYDGALTVAQFKAAGNLGIGTFEGLDGEAIMLDGVVYQVKGDSSVSIPEYSRHMPFGACTLFDYDLRRNMKHVASFEIFSTTLETNFEDKQRFCAVRAEGLFNTIRVRSCDKQEKPYRPLAEATKQQHEYTYEKTRGTLVGFWTPPFVPGAIGVPGFHLHFLSDDHTKGGHVLDFQSDTLAISLDPTPRLTIDFSTPVDRPLMERDIEQQVHDSERQRK
ncbi:MAG: acetolactate decarboxylase [bacterium]